MNGKEEALKEIPPTIGPMGQCVDDLILVMRSVFGEFEEDPQIVPYKFQETQLNITLNGEKKLKIGYIKTNEFMDSCMGVQNVIDEVINALKKNNFEVSSFELNLADQLMKCVMGINGSNIGRTIEATLKGETPLPNTKKTLLFAKIPNFLKKILALGSKVMRMKRFQNILDMV